jgi:flagellar P-ring protein precursor FlgI
VEQKFPLTVTSVGDANSLVGGELVECELYAGDVPAAIAYGKISTGANILTRGTISAGQNSGGMMMLPYPLKDIINKDFMLRLNLNRSNWADADTIARQINQTPSLNPNLMETTMFAEAEPTEPVAVAANAGQVVVMIPPQFRYGDRLSAYIAGLLNVPVAVDRPAVISVNRALNSIVVTGDVRVNNAVVSLQDKTVTIRPETPEEPAAYTLADDTARSAVELEGPGSYADLSGLVDTMNAMGLTTEQIISMFEELRVAGAINAELISQ